MNNSNKLYTAKILRKKRKPLLKSRGFISAGEGTRTPTP